MIELTPELFNYFCDNILKEKERVQLKGINISIIADTLTHMPEECRLIWHIQLTKEKHYYLWRRKEWLATVERWEKVKADSKLFNEILDERKAMFRRVCEAVAEGFGLGSSAVESEMIKSLAVKIMQNKPQAAAKLLGIENINELRDLPSKVYIMDEDIEI